MTLLICALIIFSFLCLTHGSYDDAYRLEQTLFTNYSSSLRPVQNTSQPLVLKYHTEIGYVVDVDVIHGKFSVIGQMGFGWRDEKLQWDPSKHGGITKLHLHTRSVWHPYLELLNSMGVTGVFEDSHSAVQVEHTGDVVWMPGGLLTSLCVVELTKFPFDSHTCWMIFRLTFMSIQEVVLQPSDHLVQKPFKENGEWEVKRMLTTTPVAGPIHTVLPIQIVITRRPNFFIINFFIPVTLLSILNLLSFVLVVEDGSVNIGYSMTILLAYTIYVTVLVDHVPSVSTNMPFVIHYLFSLFGISLLTTVDIIFIVWLNNMEEKQEKKQKRDTKFANAMSKLINFNKMNKNTPTSNSGQADHGSPSQDIVQTSSNTMARDHPENHTIKDGDQNDIQAISPFPVKTCFGNLNDFQTQADESCDVRDTRDKDTSRDQDHVSSIPSRRRDNKYKNMSGKVRIGSLYFFTLINTLSVAVTLYQLLG